MGHLAHNANLSVKAILGLAAYGDLCRMRGDTAEADRNIAGWPNRRPALGQGGGGRRPLPPRLRQAETWSQKYNLVWDRILGLNVFPPDVAQKEIAYYKSVMQQYGVPLDSRTHLTKTDWSIWSATLADNQADFETLISPIYDYLNQTTARDPVADSYITDNVRSGGMHARPVVGGFFIKMLSDRPMWKKWAARTKSGPAPGLPCPASADHHRPGYLTGRAARLALRDRETGRRLDEARLRRLAVAEGPALFGTVGGPHTRWTTATSGSGASSPARRPFPQPPVLCFPRRGR